VRKPQRALPQQRLSYTPKHGFTTAMVEEGSGGQPLYLIEILHDE
jgi:hypothetical protein